MRASSMMLTDPCQFEWVEAELPSSGTGQLLVETIAGAISIGTELPHYLGTSRGVDLQLPVMTGYESVGRILQCGPGVHHLVPGDRVVSFYGHRTHAIVPSKKAIPVPPDIGDELAVLTILSCDAAKGVRKLTPQPDDRVLVTGGGTIGLMALWTLRAYGVESVDVVEPIAERREIARRFGAANVFALDETAQIPGEYSCGVECSSHDTAFALLHVRRSQTVRSAYLPTATSSHSRCHPIFTARNCTSLARATAGTIRPTRTGSSNGLTRMKICLPRCFNGVCRGAN